jgi:hypothetical protein
MTDEKFRAEVKSELAADIAGRKRDDGGPAFPYERKYSDGVMGVSDGMTLRDYAALHAPADEIRDIVPSTIGECAAYIGISFSEYVADEHYAKALAKARFAWADAMLAERAKR